MLGTCPGFLRGKLSREGGYNGYRVPDVCDDSFTALKYEVSFSGMRGTLPTIASQQAQSFFCLLYKRTTLFRNIRNVWRKYNAPKFFIFLIRVVHAFHTLSLWKTPVLLLRGLHALKRGCVATLPVLFRRFVCLLLYNGDMYIGVPRHSSYRSHMIAYI